MANKKHTSAASEYEKRICSLLKDLGFEKVRGGADFKIGGNQIDAVAIGDGHIVVVEATTQRTLLKSKLQTFNGKISSIRRGLDKFPEYRSLNKKNNVRFILACRYTAIMKYEKSAWEDYKIQTWGALQVDYYEKLAKKIPNRALYDVLSDLRFTTNSEEVLYIPAFKIEYQNKVFFNFFIDPIDLIKISYVARREVGKKDYYQRIIDTSRLPKIRKYLKSGGFFPTNIVVAFNKKYTFKKQPIIFKNSDTKMPKWPQLGILSLPRSYDSCWIVDGQHRLFSFEKGMKQQIAVMALGNLSTNKQASCFVNINKKAKPISSQLLWDLDGDLRPSSEEGIISNAVKICNEKAPFNGNISIPSVGKGTISISSFCSSLKTIGLGKKDIKSKTAKYIKNPLHKSDPAAYSTQIASAMCLYFNKLDLLIGDQDMILRSFVNSSGGVSVFIYLYRILMLVEEKRVIGKIAQKYLSPVVKSMQKMSEEEIKEYKSKCSSEGGKKLVLTDFLKILLPVNQSVSEFLDESIELKERLKKLEIKFREIMKFELKKRNFENMKKKINPAVVQKIEESLGENYSSDDFCDKLSFGQLIQIMTKELWKDVFKTVFMRPEDSQDANDPRFTNKALLDTSLLNANKIRNNLVHRDYVISFEEQTHLENLIKRIFSVLTKTYK